MGGSKKLKKKKRLSPVIWNQKPMRIVMPLFEFCNESSSEFKFSGGKYALLSFDAANEVPQIDLFSKYDVKLMEMERWALVAEVENPEHYKQEINILLLSFRIYKLARVFIKYRLCKEDAHFCSMLSNYMRRVMPEESNSIITLGDLGIIDKGFSALLKMEATSDRTHNAIYFMYRGFCADKMIDSFTLLMCALESLFSNEKRHGATRTICTRASKFLNCKPGCEYKDIEELYDLRSRIIHGKFKVDVDIKGKLKTLYKLQYVLIECMKRLLDENIFPIYSDVKTKEDYFAKL